MNPRFRLDQRAAGILLHPTSLPGPHGSGDLGAEAHRFARFLAKAGQRWWQMLPIGPIGTGNAPYCGTSALAGNPLLIDLTQLKRRRLLTKPELDPLPSFSARAVNFPAVIRFRESRLRLAFKRFAAQPRNEDELASFRENARDWLDDYSLFTALKRAHHGAAWTSWERDLRTRKPAALRRARQRLCTEINYHGFVQYLFSAQWDALRSACHDQGVGLIGDAPMFVSHESCDVWAHPDLFLLDKRGQPTAISGVPPDLFSSDGQLWRHPLYRWPRHLATRFSWWIQRFRRISAQFDAVRIDHFLGFHRCWTVAGGAKTARKGVWKPSPGKELFDAVRGALGSLEIIAEDLGVSTPEATTLRKACGFPGMRLLQNGFGEGVRYDQPHNYPRRCAAYTGTHDNNPLVMWFKNLSRGRGSRGADGRSTRERVLRYTNGSARNIHWDMIRTLYSSPADLAVVPMQDVLGLGREGLMNRPGKARGNWKWRMRSGATTARLAERMAELANTYERSTTTQSSRAQRAQHLERTQDA